MSLKYRPEDPADMLEAAFQLFFSQKESVESYMGFESMIREL